MRIVLLSILLGIGIVASAQERCASFEYNELQKSTNLSEAKRIAEAESFAQRFTSAAAKEAGPVLIKIPVVVHILYKDAAQNISDAQVKSQIDALNKDFRRLNADTTNTPERFLPLAADVQIEFYLATADPKGRATSGILRKQTSIANFLANDKIKSSSQGGDDAWDSKSYLNIWVGKLTSGAGYSSAPGSDGSKDGIVINTSAFGTINVSGYYNLGRTATHEIGHWLGLKHIWGDAPCGDDGISDTPQQSTFTQGCPTGFRTSCTNGEVGDMYMNFMDYTSDACMNMFTAGQKKKMLASFVEGGARFSFLQSKGLNQPWLEESYLETSSGVTVYPNPATNIISIKVGIDAIGKTASIFTTNGVLVQAVQLKSITQTVSLTTLKAGIYFIKIDGATQKLIKL